MADDILGHEHLDHGKHLHKPGFHPKPAYWMGVWVRHPREHSHREHADPHADGDHHVTETRSHAPTRWPMNSILKTTALVLAAGLVLIVLPLALTP